MFQGGIRHDFNGAEILALKAADCREGHLKDLLAEEEFAKQKGAEEDKDIQYIDKDIMKDDRTKLMMEDCLAMLGNVHERRFLRPDLLSANPNISQLVWLIHEGQRYAIWSYTKHDFGERSEAKEGVITINCDLSTYEHYDHGRIVRCQHNGNV